MAGVSRKPDRDRSLNFEGFLNNLQQWDSSIAEGERKTKPQADRGKRVDAGKSGFGSDVWRSTAGGSGTSPRIGAYEYSRNPGGIGWVSSGTLDEESSPSAASEKELGNEYFKKKDFHKAIECYSRSIALSPMAVAFANRAMAYLKIKSYEEAENDCTEALNLDDRYVKAYSRRATARKELRKLRESIEDSEFALRLEPNNQELQKLYTETKVLYGKQHMKTSEALKSSLQGIQVVEDRDSGAKGADNLKPSISHPQSMSKSKAHSVNEETNSTGGKHMLKTSMLEVAARASSLVMASSTKNITIPRSAYEFEVSWRSLSDDSALQASLLKSISPASLPQLFKSALSAPLLIDIVKTIATIFKEEMNLAVSFLDNLTKVPRFDMIVMCLSGLDRAEITRIWDDVFCGPVVPAAQLEALAKLRSKFCPRC